MTRKNLIILILTLALIITLIPLTTYADSFTSSDYKLTTVTTNTITYYDIIKCYVLTTEADGHEFKTIIQESEQTEQTTKALTNKYLNKQIEILYSTTNNYIYNQFDIIYWQLEPTKQNTELAKQE